jgi:hypothetical protein
MHEQSETIQLPSGRWVNVYGRSVPQAGQQLPGTPDFGTMDEAVQAAQLRSEQTRELSDAEVGLAPAAPTRELSDAEVFGGGRQVGGWEAAGRAGRSLLHAANAYAAAPAIGVARLADVTAGLFGAEPGAADYIADRFVVPSLNQVERAGIQEGEVAGPASTVAMQAAPELGKFVPDIAMGMGLQGAARQPVKMAADSAFGAVKNILRQGFVAGVPAGNRVGIEREIALRNEGVDPLTAGLQGGASGAMTAGQFALPAAAASRAATLPARVASRGVQGAGLATTANMVQQQAENAMLPEGAERLRHDITDPGTLAVQAALGALVAQGAGRVPGARPSRQRLGYDGTTPLDLASLDEALVPVEPPAARPEPKPEYDPVAAARQVVDRIYEMPEGAPEAPPMRLLPRDTEVTGQVQPDVSDVPVRVAPDYQVEGGEQVGRVRREFGEQPIEPVEAPTTRTAEKVEDTSDRMKPNVPMRILHTLEGAARDSGLESQIRPRIDELPKQARVIEYEEEGGLVGERQQPPPPPPQGEAPPPPPQSTQVEASVQAEAPPPPKQRKQPKQQRPGTAFLSAVRKAGGVDSRFSEDIGGDSSMVLNRRSPGLFRKGGMSADALVEWAQDNGYITEAQVREADKRGVGGSQELVKNLIRRAMKDEDITPIGEEGFAKQMSGEEFDQKAHESAYDYARQQGLEVTRDMSLEQIDRAIAEFDAKRAVEVTDGLKPSDADDIEMIAHASELDEVGVERLAVQHPDGGPEFMAGIRRIIENGESKTVGQGGADVQSNAREGGTAGNVAEAPREAPRGEGVRAGERASQSARDEQGGIAGAGDDFRLEQQTEQQLRARDAERQRAAEQQRRVESAPPPEEFTLTGSNRTADQAEARGQQGLFEQQSVGERMRAERAEREAKLKSQVEAVGDIGDGVVLRHKDGRKWAMVLRDAAGEAEWRVQRFDEDGFSGHEAVGSKQQALERAVRDGFTARDDAALETLFPTKRFQRGLSYADLIRRHNTGELNIEQFHAEVAKLYDEAKQIEEQARGEQPKKDGTAGTLFANPIEPVLKFAGKLLGFDDAHLGRMADDVKGMWGRRDEKAQNPVAKFARTIGFSIDGQFRALERVYDSKAIAAVRRLFNADPGQGTSVGRTYGEAVNTRSIEFRNRLMETMRSYVDEFGDSKAVGEDKAAAREQIVKKLQNRRAMGNGSLDKAAKEVAAMLDEIVDYMREAGVKIEKIPDYFPRIVDVMAVLGNPDAFKAAARRAYEAAGLTVDEAKAAADAYHKQITLGGQGVVESPFIDFGNSIPRADFARHRQLSKAADSILRDFLIQDPIDVLETYIHKSVRRAEWERRLGGEVEYVNIDGHKVKGKRYDALREEILKEGNVRAVPFVDDLVRASVGEIPSNVGAGMRTAASWARALTVAEFLRHATLTSLTEPLLTGVRTGKASKAFSGYLYALEDIARRAGKWAFGDMNVFKNAGTEQARRIAEMVGIVENHLATSAAHVLQADGMVESSKVANKLATRATILSGLRQWTDATRIASVRVGMEFIAEIAADAAKGDKVAQRSLRELGIADAQQSGFSKWLSQQRDIEATLKTRAGDKAMRDAYVTALGRFTDQVIMAPKNADKPYWANHPIGSVAYQLTGYLYAFQQNVLNRLWRQGKSALLEEGWTAGERAKLLAPVMYLGMLPLMQLALIPVRDAIRGTRQEKRDEKWSKTSKVNIPGLSEIDTGVPMAVTEAFSRSGLLGAADPLVNLVTNARYEKRPSSVLLGPYGQNVESLFTDTFGRNAPTTNTQERRVARDIYQAFVDPAVTLFATAYLPGPAAVAVSQGMGMERTKEAFSTTAAGPRKSKQQDKLLP